MLSVLFAIPALLVLGQLLYPAVAVVLARLRAPRMPAQNDRQYHYACIITAYRNVDIARPLVVSLLEQRYPHFSVYLVADDCPEPAWHFNDARVHILRPEQALRLKVKSIAYACERFARPHDYIVVFDADNLAHPDFLEHINRRAQEGWPCIQGQRTAKNLDTHYAALDSMGEHYKNYLERFVPWQLGSSAVIAGSGMATETTLYRAYLDSPEIRQGRELGKKMLQEDKILQNFLLRRNERIAWEPRAIVYDEKTAAAAAVETQRSRWLYSYFQNIPNAFGLIRRGLLGGSFNQLYFGAITLVLPMFVQVGVALLLGLAGWFVSGWWTLAFGAALLVFGLSVIGVLYLDKAPAPVWRALWRVPLFVWRQFRGLFKMRNPHKHFHHTEHRQEVSLDEMLRQHER